MRAKNEQILGDGKRAGGHRNVRGREGSDGIWEGGRCIQYTVCVDTGSTGEAMEERVGL